MEAGVTTTTIPTTSSSSFRSILDKPLTQLTEDDISQLTREDCRNYLKQKGMRRPSWNKSQAIQQVISLKALLELPDDSGSGGLCRILLPKLPTATPNLVVKDVVDAPNIDVFQGPVLEEDDNVKGVPSLRSPDARNVDVGQLTIFYCGKVNVYDGVSTNKAQAILHLAASPIQCPPDDPSNGFPPLPPPSFLQTTSEKNGLLSPGSSASQTAQSEKILEYQQCRDKGNVTYDPDLEGHANRKVSLQRYREKKKDRLKGRRSLGPAPSSLEAYLNHHERSHNTNVQPALVNTLSTPQPAVSHFFGASADTQSKMARISVDLNEDILES